MTTHTMTPAQHYAEAERIARACQRSDFADAQGFSYWERSDLAALAQVHATLALYGGGAE